MRRRGTTTREGEDTALCFLLPESVTYTLLNRVGIDHVGVEGGGGHPQVR